jgi:lysophospholipase L1-like esterase
MKKRVFPIISAAVFAIFAAHLGYIYYRKIYNLCTEQTLEPGVGMYMEFSDMTPMAVFFIIAALIALATLVVLIFRAVRPNLALGIVGSVLTVITCGIYFFSDLKYELFYMFKYVFGLSSAEAPILGMCEWFKIFFVFFVILEESIAFADLIAPKRKGRMFSIISASTFGVFSSVMIYILVKKAYYEGCHIVMNPVDGQYVVESDFLGWAIPFLISAGVVALTLIVLIVRAIRPNIVLAFIGSLMTIACSLMALVYNLSFETFMFFFDLFNIRSIELTEVFPYVLAFLSAVPELFAAAVIFATPKELTLADVLKGKNLSVFGASMCTYDGYSNNTSHNPTIGANKQYYGTPDSENVKCRDLTVNETFWGRLIDKYEMTLCVNNSWSGSKILDDNPAAAGWNTRPTELHRTDGTEPDLIVSFMGNNDFTKERPAGEITDDLFARAETDGFAPETFAEGYAVMLGKVTKRYPNAKVFLFNMAWRTEEKSELLIKYNEIIEKCAEHYGAFIVRLTESRMSRLDYAKYTCDGKLHPDSEGMAIWAELIEDAMKICYKTR